MNSERRVILYIAMSLDGYIAGPDDDLSFLSTVEQEGQDYGYAEFIKTIDAVIVGRRTYDKVLSMGYDFPHSDKDAYVLTRTPRPDLGSVKFYSGNPKDLIARLRQKPGKNIFVDGGAETVRLLLQEGLIDEFYISIVPTLLGDGIPLFEDGLPTTQLKLMNTKSFEKGLAQLHYITLRETTSGS
jgi:dihydrofolate reductase